MGVNILAIIGIITSVCNNMNYFRIDDAVLRADTERRILRDVESNPHIRVHWRDLQQRENFINIVRNSSRMSEAELEDALANVFN